MGTPADGRASREDGSSSAATARAGAVERRQVSAGTASARDLERRLAVAVEAENRRAGYGAPRAEGTAEALEGAGVTTASCEPIWPLLVPVPRARWLLDEGGGTVVRDDAGANLHGTVVAPGWAPGRDDGVALRFDGEQTLVRVGAPETTPLALALGDELTLCVWIRPDAEPASATRRVIMAKEGAYVLARRADGEVMLGFPVSGTCKWFALGKVAAGEWHHVAVVYRDGEIHSHLDGGRASACQYVGAPGHFDEPGYEFRIGQRYLRGDRPWLGQIADVTVFDSALSHWQIRLTAGLVRWGEHLTFALVDQDHQLGWYYYGTPGGFTLDLNPGDILRLRFTPEEQSPTRIRLAVQSSGLSAAGWWDSRSRSYPVWLGAVAADGLLECPASALGFERATVVGLNVQCAGSLSGLSLERVGAQTPALSALSPNAYLRDLLDVVADGLGVDAQWCEDRFRQPFTAMTTDRRAATEAVAHPRLVLSILERYLAAGFDDRGSLYKAVDRHGAPSLLDGFYDDYLSELGTSRQELSDLWAGGWPPGPEYLKGPGLTLDELASLPPSAATIEAIEALPALIARARTRGLTPTSDAYAASLEQAVAAITRVHDRYIPLIRDRFVQYAVDRSGGSEQALAAELHVDLAAGETRRTTPLALAIETLQTFVFSCRLGKEPTPGAGAWNERRWRWMQSYGLWHAAQMLRMYPEDFAIPAVRRDSTDLFDTLLQEIEGATPATVEVAVADYARGMQDLRKRGLGRALHARLAERVFLAWQVEGQEEVELDEIDPEGGGIRCLARLAVPASRLFAVAGFHGRLYFFFATAALGPEDEAEPPRSFDAIEYCWVEPDQLAGPGETVRPRVTALKLPSALLPTAILNPVRYTPAVATGEFRGAPALQLYLVPTSGGLARLSLSTADKVLALEEFILPAELKTELSRAAFSTVGRLPGQRTLLMTGPAVPTLPRQTCIIEIGEYEAGPWPYVARRWRSGTAAPTRSYAATLAGEQLFFSAHVPASEVMPGVTRFWVLDANATLGPPQGAGMAIVKPPFNAPVTWIEVVYPGIVVGKGGSYELASLVPCELLANGTCWRSDAKAPAAHPLSGDADQRAAYLQWQRTAYEGVSVRWGRQELLLDEWCFHVPLAAAWALAGAGYYEDALRWLKVVYDPYQSSEEDRLLWEGFRRPAGLELTTETPSWLNDPFDPHGIAAHRTGTLLRHTVLAYSELLLDWGDRLFAGDSGESVARARELYAEALAVLNYDTLRDRRAPDDSDMRVVAPNPLLDLYRLRAEANLEKIRQGRNQAGESRALQPYARAVDAAAAAKAAATGALDELSRIDASEPVPVHRYQYLHQSAESFINFARQLGSTLLEITRAKEAGALDALRAQQASGVAAASVGLQDLRLAEAGHAETAADLQHSRALLQRGHFDRLINEGVSAIEMGALYALMASAALSLFDPGQAAGALGGSLQLAASFQRREQEWRLQRKLADKDVLIADQHRLMAQDHTAIVTEEREIAELQRIHAEAVMSFLSNRFLTAQLYAWLERILLRLYRQQTAIAVSLARMAQQALSFERQEHLAFIGPPSQYWDVDRHGLLAADELLADLGRLEEHRLKTERRRRELTKVFSLARYAPLELQQLRETGDTEFTTLLDWFDRDFPGHYLRLVKYVTFGVVALVPPGDAIHATLSTTGTSRVVAGPPFGEPKVILRQPEAVSVTAASNASGLFEVRLNDPLLLPFEGSGVETTWRIELPKGANRFDFGSLADVQLTIHYTALDDRSYRQHVLARLGADASGNVAVDQQIVLSARDGYPDAWYECFNEPADEHILRLHVAQSDLAPNESGHRMRSVLIATTGEGPARLPVQVTFKPDAGPAHTAAGEINHGRLWIDAVPAFGDQAPFGVWEIALPRGAPADPPLADWLTDAFLGIRYTATTSYPT